MILQSDITTRTVDGQTFTCIRIGESRGDLPRHLLQGKKQEGYIVKGGRIEPWLYHSFFEQDGYRFLSIPQIDIMSVSTLATTQRPYALQRVQELAGAMLMLPSSFMNLNNGIFPTWRIYFIQGGGILFFPEVLSDIFAATVDDQMRYEAIGAWIHHGVGPSMSLCDQMTQLLYFAVTSVIPFQQRSVREDNFRLLPLTIADAVLAPTLPLLTATWIDRTLALTARTASKISTDPPKETLQWFLTQTASLQWDLPQLEKAQDIQLLQQDEACAKFLQKQDKRARRTVFLRKKGWIIALVAVLVIGGATFAGMQIQRALEPPYTAGMDAQQVIQEYYLGQNNLDISQLEASFARGVKSPVSMEVSNLFVTRQMRMAYEGLTTVIPVQEWIAQGKPAIPATASVYGVTDIKITQLSEDEYRATSLLYAPYDYEDVDDTEDTEATAVPGEMQEYLYAQSQDFRMVWNKRGWWEIAQIGELHYEALGPTTIKTYEPKKAMASPMAATN